MAELSNPNPVEVKNPAPAQATPQTFDDVLQDKTMQAEFDRRITKAIQTAQAKAEDVTKKSALTVEELKKQLDTQNATLADYMNREAVIKAGVDPKYLKYVAYEVKQTMADGTDFGTALDTYVKANPQYTATQQQQPLTPPTSGWGAPQGGSTKTVTGVEAAFAKLNPNLKLE